LPPVSLTLVANLPPVSTTVVKVVAKFATGVVDTGDKFAVGVVDTGGNFAAGVVDTGGKFATDVVDTGGAQRGLTGLRRAAGHTKKTQELPYKKSIEIFLDKSQYLQKNMFFPRNSPSLCL
jgi:predicted ribonuclease toxin of YeeF-YezG toxin-antitoxin module